VERPTATLASYLSSKDLCTEDVNPHSTTYCYINSKRASNIAQKEKDGKNAMKHINSMIGKIKQIKQI